MQKASYIQSVAVLWMGKYSSMEPIRNSLIKAKYNISAGYCGTLSIIESIGGIPDMAKTACHMQDMTRYWQNILSG